MGYRGIGRPTHYKPKKQIMAKVTERVTQRGVTQLANAVLGDILIFPEFIENFGYTRTQTRWEDSATPEDMKKESNENGQILNEAGQVVGQVEWRSNGLLALSIIEGQPKVLFLNSRGFKASEKITGDNKNTTPFMNHSGSRLIMRGFQSRQAVYKIVAEYDAVRTNKAGRDYIYSQLGIDEVVNNITYTDAHIIVGEEKFLIDDIVKLYDDIFA